MNRNVRPKLLLLYKTTIVDINRYVSASVVNCSEAKQSTNRFEIFGASFELNLVLKACASALSCSLSKKCINHYMRVRSFLL